jgi:hypothetical protein
MSTTHLAIDELDVVALQNVADGWPAGTEGTVVSDLGSHMWVEIGNEHGECLDIVSVPPEQLQLIWKSP